MGIADSPLKDRVVFVEGAPGSGTTWLVTLLAMHPEIAGVEAESHLFDFGVDRMFDNLEHRDEYRHGLVRYIDRDELVDLVRDLCDGVLLAMRSRASGGATPAFVVEGTPVAGGAEDLALARRRECYPDAWYLHVVRDRGAGGGDLPRYRELSYEELRADPAAVCGALFDWLGVATGEETLDAIRALPRGQASAPTTARSTRSELGLARRRLLAKIPSRTPAVAPGSGVAFLLIRALFHREAEALRALTAPEFEFVHRSPGADLSLRGDDGRNGLVRLAEETFGRRYVSEWWGSPGVGPGEWWTSAAGTPFSTIFFLGVGGDASRVDIAIGLVLEGDLIRRAVVVSAGALAGRPVLAHAVAAEDSDCGSST
jgi:hypothetical protein